VVLWKLQTTQSLNTLRLISDASSRGCFDPTELITMVLVHWTYNQDFGKLKWLQKYVCKSTLITKLYLFNWTIMPFGMKNATNTFSETMTKVFGAYMDKFLKVFVDDLNVHYLTWEEHIKHLRYMFM
jgi:hypothetical protein